MLPRTGNTLIGPFSLTPGIVPAPASAPLSVCAEARTPATTEPASNATTNHLFRIAERLSFLPVLRIHRLWSAARRFIRDFVVVGEFVEVRIDRKSTRLNFSHRT